MNLEQHIESLYTLSVTAGMNQRYHRAKMSRYGKDEVLIQRFVGILAVIGVVFSLLSFSIPSKWSLWFNITSAIVSVFSLIVAIVLNISSAGKLENEHRDLYRRWSDLRELVDDTLTSAETLDSTQEPPEDLAASIQKLTAIKNRINALEDEPDRELLMQSFEDENEARTGYRNQAEQERATMFERSDRRTQKDR